ncbi:MAG: 50S ribosomal protein L9 [Gemmataceae bacterium]|nr:50S ribosomal protein L9 [Gemmataceae bacterium]
MLLVLTQDLEHVGKQGEVVEISPGYGRNYLLPRGMATVPTQHNLRLVERFKVKLQQARDAKIADIRAMAEQINRLGGVNIEAKVNPEGHLYGSVGAAEISKALKGKNLMVESEMVLMEGAIKETGIYAVKLNLGYDIETELTVAVIPGK